jgi:cell wall-associated NlpC family hydrolase
MGKGLAVLAAGAAVLVPVSLTVLAGAASQQSPVSIPAAAAPTRLAIDSIPPAYLNLYIQAASTCPGLPWQVLAGIGEVETDHGRANLPGVLSGANFAGAEGPMQFEPATFTAFETGPNIPASPYDPADAVYTAARMLCQDGAASGTLSGIRAAVFAYNHAGWYVSEVLSWAARYGTASESPAAAEAIAFAEGQLGKPYIWGGTGPVGFDCSGLVYEAYLHAGITIARTTYAWRQDGPQVPLNQLQPGDLLFSAGSDGTPSNPGHVVLYLGGGRVIQAPQTGQLVQIDPLSLSGVVAATRPAGTGPLQIAQGGATHVASSSNHRPAAKRPAHGALANRRRGARLRPHKGL